MDNLASRLGSLRRPSASKLSAARPGGSRQQKLAATEGRTDRSRARHTLSTMPPVANPWPPKSLAPCLTPLIARGAPIPVERGILVKNLPTRQDFAHVLRGLAMGAADVIPGVSGGTVALILGIYGRLVGALSRADRTLLTHIRHGHWSEAAAYLDVRFLVALGSGIVLGIVILGGTMNELLQGAATRPLTLSAFFGMIAGSAVIVWQLVEAHGRPGRSRHIVLAVAAGCLAFVVTGLPSGSAELTRSFVFFCGMVGICAMILPGLSGAYLLYVLGVYTPLTDILKRLPRGDVTGQDAVLVVVFGAGCGLGLLCFSKFLRWLLHHHEAATMAVLCGFMVGALRKIWPFQELLHEHGEHARFREWQLFIPDHIDGNVVACVAVAGLAALLVFAVHRFVHNDVSAPADAA